MANLLEHADDFQTYLLGVMDDGGNSWEQLNKARGLAGIMEILNDQQLELMYGMRCTEVDVAEWTRQQRDDIPSFLMKYPD